MIEMEMKSCETIERRLCEDDFFSLIYLNEE